MPAVRLPRARGRDESDLGRCGAHFVGLNARHIAWNYYDRPADEWMTEHWLRNRAALYARTGDAPLALHEASSV